MLKIGIIGLGGISKKHITEICDCDKGEIVAIDTPTNLESKTAATNAIEVIIEDRDNKMNTNMMRFVNYTHSHTHIICQTLS